MGAVKSPLLTLTRNPVDERYLRLNIDDQDRYYQIKRNETRFYKALCSWAATTSGEKKILRVTKDVLEGIGFCFKEIKHVNADGIIEGLEAASKVLSFASIWNNMKTFGETSSSFGKSLISLVQEVAKQHFPLSGVANQPAETEEEIAARKEVLETKVKEVALNGELLVFSGCFLVKDIVKLIQKIVVTPFEFLRVFLKFLSPALSIWALRYDTAKLWTHIKDRRAMSKAKQTAWHTTLLTADLSPADQADLTLAREVINEKIKHDCISIALDVAYLAMAIISLVTLALVPVMPPALGIALSITSFLALIASCANKISQNMMSGSLKEVEDEHDRAALIALQADDGAGVGVGADGIGVA